MQLDLLASNPGNEKRKGRPAVHADSAARKRAHRASLARIDYADDPAIVATVAEIAAELGQSKAEVMKSLVRFALTNRNWKQVGLYGAKGH
jgi:DNA-directed RNA polymerase specialized sigma subunit